MLCFFGLIRFFFKSLLKNSINFKVCLIVRDDVERNCVALTNGRNESDEPSINGTTIPEMEDLYEDLCDGTCICTLVSFYRPDELPLKGFELLINFK